MDPDTDPLVTGLDVVFCWVSDLDRSVGFYRDVLGLPLARRDGDRWAEFDIGGRRFALHRAGSGQLGGGSGATAVFSVADLGAARRVLAGLGLASTHEGEVLGYARFATFEDPDGNPFQLIEHDPGQEG